ncbi:MAG TPA: flagellar filament capping protein FliD [Acidobacteriaceae bacterium]|nr:flagellar filament capping protein FliD [Acidobacteriaceae bacterium]
MGAVGISFGNPTSGQGFNVSQTVSQIVANLQAVETPWQTQLTSLQSQDTALTGIGTDLSTLASALESLTDFDGVLSEKEGSSSDTSVVQLMSATSSAAAGSHTITVSQLAQTSSYVSSQIGASDTLSGSVAINGQNIQIESGTNDTLSTLVSYINSGGYGVTASVITDSDGDQQLGLASTTSGAAGDIAVSADELTDATSSNAAITFQQSQPGQDAQFSVDGLPTQSSPSNTVTNAISGVTMQLLSLSSSPVQVEITNDNTDVESAVSSFVSAYNTVVNDLNTQEGDDASGNAEPLFGNSEVAMIQEQLQEAISFTQPAQAVGTTSSVAATDTLSGTISISVGGGQAVQVSVPTGTPTLQGLADAINGTAGIGVTAAVATAKNGGATLTLTNSTTGSEGDIVVDSSGLMDTTSNAAVSFGQAQSNGITSLTGLGITANDDGTLALDTTTLDNALNDNYDDVMSFFQSSSLFTSFGSNLSSTIGNLGNTSPSGAVYMALQQNSSEESQLNTNISNENAIISAEQSQLTTELNEANYTLQEIPEQIDEINEMYSAITGYNQNSNG